MERSNFFYKQLNYLFSFDVDFCAAVKIGAAGMDSRQFQRLSFFQEDAAKGRDSAVYNVFDETRAMGREAVRGHVTLLEGGLNVQPFQEFGLLSGRALIDTEEARIFLVFEGTVRCPNDDSLWLQSERVVESKAFLSLRFETPSTKYAWLVSEQCVGFGRLAQENQVASLLSLDVYAASANGPADD